MALRPVDCGTVIWSKSQSVLFVTRGHQLANVTIWRSEDSSSAMYDYTHTSLPAVVPVVSDRTRRMGKMR